MFLKHLAMQFLEEFFLMVFWCTTISFCSFFFVFCLEVSEYFARLLMQITKTVERFLKVHIVSSDFNHIFNQCCFFPCTNKCYLQKINGASFGYFRFPIYKMLYVTFISFFWGQIIFCEITFIFRRYKKRVLGSNLLNTNLMFL